MRRIVHARSEKYALLPFQQETFKPKITIIDVIDWQNTTVTEPPILTNIAVDNLKILVTRPRLPKYTHVTLNLSKNA